MPYVHAQSTPCRGVAVVPGVATAVEGIGTGATQGAQSRVTSPDPARDEVLADASHTQIGTVEQVL